LAFGQEYAYTIEARWIAADGTRVEQKRQIQVTAGANVQVDLSKPQP
jgi:hypothetical protein